MNLSSSGAICLLLQKQKPDWANTGKQERDSNQPIEKQHTDNRSKEDKSHRGGKGEKDKETERGGKESKKKQK